MDNKPLESLVKIGQLKKEALSESEWNNFNDLMTQTRGEQALVRRS